MFVKGTDVITKLYKTKLTSTRNCRSIFYTNLLLCKKCHFFPFSMGPCKRFRLGAAQANEACLY